MKDHPIRKLETAAVISMTVVNKMMLKRIYSDCGDIDQFMTWWDDGVKRGQKFMSMSRPWKDYHGGSAETLEEALERHNGVFADHILRGSGISPNGQRYIKESV